MFGFSRASPYTKADRRFEMTPSIRMLAAEMHRPADWSYDLSLKVAGIKGQVLHGSATTTTVAVRRAI